MSGSALPPGFDSSEAWERLSWGRCEYDCNVSPHYDDVLLETIDSVAATAASGSGTSELCSSGSGFVPTRGGLGVCTTGPTAMFARSLRARSVPRETRRGRLRPQRVEVDVNSRRFRVFEQATHSRRRSCLPPLRTAWPSTTSGLRMACGPSGSI